MSSINLQQWWENSYRRQHLDSTSQDLDSAELHYSTLDYNQLTTDQDGSPPDLDYGNFSIGNPYDLDAVNGYPDPAISSLTLLLLAISYGLVVFGGVVGNSTLVLTLCSASSVRLRNPLLLAVCIADLLVTGISAPVTLLNLAMNRRTRSLPLVLCKLIHYIQVGPVTVILDYSFCNSNPLPGNACSGQYHFVFHAFPGPLRHR